MGAPKYAQEETDLTPRETPTAPVQRFDEETTLLRMTRDSSGWGIGKHARRLLSEGEGNDSLLLKLAGGDIENVTAQLVGEAAKQGDSFSRMLILESLVSLAEAICAVIGNGRLRNKDRTTRSIRVRIAKPESGNNRTSRLHGES